MKYKVLILVENAFQKMFTSIMDVAVMIQAETIKNKIEVGGNFASSNKLLDFVAEHEIVQGIYILEIELLDESGLDVAEQLLQVDPKAQFIFITRSVMSANHIFFRRIQALDCIVVNPVKTENLQERMNVSLELAVRTHDLVSKTPQNIFIYQVGREIYFENLDNVICVTTSHKAHHLDLHLLNTTVDITGNLQKLLERYPTLKQISQSCIANIQNIKSVNFSAHKIIFRNGKVEYYPTRTNYKIKKLLKDFL